MTSEKRKSPDTEIDMPSKKKQKINKYRKKKDTNKNVKGDTKTTFAQDMENLNCPVFRKYYGEMNLNIFDKLVVSDEHGNVTHVNVTNPEVEFNTAYEKFKEELPITFRINPVNDERAQYVKSLVESHGKEIDKIQFDKGQFFLDMDEKRLSFLGKEIEKLNSIPEDQLTDRQKEVKSIYSTSISNIKSRVYNPDIIPGPTPIPWFPNKLGYYFPVSKRILAKAKQLIKFKTFLLPQTESGNISRQEMVSMLPPQFFNYQPHHKILDMCAAPGSKTAQLLEGLHQAGKTQGKPVTGFVVANDNNVNRCHLLVKQLQRLGPLFANMIITSHDATIFPGLRYNGKQLQFDSILCDVMCSGDGTLRKSADLWTRWNTRMGPALHDMQIRVTMRAFKLLAPGGRIVYSTCSINPIEDEAVVAEILRRTKGQLKLINCEGHLKNFKYAPGVSTWNVCNRSGEKLTKEDIVGRAKYKESMFPPSEEESQSMNLNYCMRLFPHLQDSGGFFVAVLEKESSQTENVVQETDELEEMDIVVNEENNKENGVHVDDSDSEVDIVPIEDDLSKGKVRPAIGKTTGEFEYGDISESFHNQLNEFYGISSDKVKYGCFFNRIDTNHPDVRKDIPRRIFYAPENVREILSLNDKAGRPWKIINVGLRVFEHAKRIVGTEANLSVEQYRICQEGVDILFGESSKRILNLPISLFKLLAEKRELTNQDIKNWAEENNDQTTENLILNFEPGPCMSVDNLKFYPVASHRTPYSLQLYCKKDEQATLFQFLKTLQE